mgnify:CR=1 FL=1
MAAADSPERASFPISSNNYYNTLRKLNLNPQIKRARSTRAPSKARPLFGTARLIPDSDSDSPHAEPRLSSDRSSGHFHHYAEVSESEVAEVAAVAAVAAGPPGVEERAQARSGSGRPPKSAYTAGELGNDKVHASNCTNNTVTN